MLAVQKYLKSGKTLDDLKAEYDVNANRHPSLPIFNLNYGVFSPKTDPITMDCRSLCLDENFDLVARSFPRFFNLHEVPEINDKFNWKAFVVLEKADGWFCKVFWYKDRWVISSRSGFGDNPVNDPSLTFEELVSQRLTPQVLDLLDKHICYTFEVVGPYTKIVHHYAHLWMFLLTAFRGEEEMSLDYTMNMGSKLSTVSEGMISTPGHYFSCTTPERVYGLIADMEKKDKTWEGVVLRDSNNMRIKVKSSTYVALHHLRGDGNLFLPKYLIPLVLSGDYTEVLAYWPEITDNFNKVKERLELHQQRLSDLWDKVKEIEVQKDFALSIRDETPFTSILFQARKQRRHPREIWAESSDQIYKVLYQ